MSASSSVFNYLANNKTQGKLASEKEKEEYNQMAARFHELEKQLEDEKTSSRKEKQAFEEELRKTISEKEKAELLKKEEIHKTEETIRKEKDEEIAALQKQLFDMQTRQLSDQAALQEAKTALLSLRLELSQAHQKELNEVRIEKDKKIEALQNELLKAFDKK